MINPSDFAPLIAPLGARPTAPPAATRGAGALAPSAWFDAAAVSGDTRIGADLNPASRGLSVAQHAAQVLSHLVGTSDDGA